MSRAALKTAGLSIRWSGAAHRLYADVIHDASGIPVRQFKQPIEGGKRRFAATVDAACGHVDWTRPAAAVAADEAAYKAIWSIENRAQHVA